LEIGHDGAAAVATVASATAAVTRVDEGEIYMQAGLKEEKTPLEEDDATIHGECYMRATEERKKRW